MLKEGRSLISAPSPKKYITLYRIDYSKIIFDDVIMAELLANISRFWMGAGDDATNSYGIPQFSYREEEFVLSIMKRVIVTPRFTEIGNNNYIKTWVFLLNQHPVGYVLHEENKITLRALTAKVPKVELHGHTDFYFDSCSNENLQDYMKKFGININ